MKHFIHFMYIAILASCITACSKEEFLEEIEIPAPDYPEQNPSDKSNYSLIDLGLKSYTLQTDGAHSFTLSIQLSNVPNLDGILKGLPILGPILNTTINSLIIDPLKTITVSTPLNLPLLGVSNLTLSGGWSTPASY